LYDPDTYDANGNPEDAVMERRGEALRLYEEKEAAKALETEETESKKQD